MVTSPRGFNKTRHGKSSRAAPGIPRMLKNSHMNPHLSRVRVGFKNMRPLSQHGPVATVSVVLALGLLQPYTQPPFLRAICKPPARLVTRTETRLLEEGLRHLLRPH